VIDDPFLFVFRTGKTEKLHGEENEMLESKSGSSIMDDYKKAHDLCSTFVLCS